MARTAGPPQPPLRWAVVLWDANAVVETHDEQAAREAYSHARVHGEWVTLYLGGLEVESTQPRRNGAQDA